VIEMDACVDVWHHHHNDACNHICAIVQKDSMAVARPAQSRRPDVLAVFYFMLFSEPLKERMLSLLASPIVLVSFQVAPTRRSLTT